ncbi:hypothetical protein Tco_0014153 [Tanacetum coccineum]
MYTRLLEFANFCDPLSKFLLCVLEYYRINLAQLSVIGAAKASHFELMCRVLGRVPTVGTFHRFYVNSISNGWLSFSKRSGVAIPCCYSKNLDSLKNWNNRLSRSYLETDVLPTFLHNDDEEMGLLDFVKSASPFKVKINERTLADNEVPLLEETEDKVISPSAQPLRLVDHTIKDELKANMGKRKRKSDRFEEAWDSKREEGAKFGIAPHPSEELISSFVTPTPEPDVHEDSGETPDVNVQTRRVPERFVVTTSSSKHGDTDVSLRVKSPLPYVPGENVRTSASAPGEGLPIDEFYESQTINSTTAQDVYVPKWNITNDARIDNPALCQDLLDHITLPRYWVDLRNQTGARFLNAFNINSAQHVCMVSKLRLRDAKIVALKARLERSEKESAELSGLRGRVSKLETEVVAKSEEVAGLNKQNAKLLGKVSALESVREELSNQLDSHIADVRRDMDTGLYPHMLNSIARRIWILGHDVRLEAEIKHGKAGRSLAQVEAYDHDVESKYVVAVNDFENVSFSLLEELEALKDSPLAPIMFALTLDGDVDSIPRLRELQPSFDQLTVPHAERKGLVPSFNSPEGVVAHVVPVQDSSLGVADYQVSTLVHTGDTSSIAPPHDDLFDTTVLDGPANP